MAVTAKRVVIWRAEVENRPGALAEALEPLAGVGTNLQVVMAYRYPGNERRAAIEIYPVTGKKMSAAAKASGFQPSSIPTLLVEGDDRAGLGYAISRAITDAGINLGFMVAQVMGRRYSCVLGFENESDARKATPLIKKTTATKRRR
jgi:hypothetical protein